jgi:hypothetical protein
MMASQELDLVVHATHEAGFKVGGIGAVLDGLLSSSIYNGAVQRTLLVGPMETANPVQMDRLIAPDNKLEIIYSSWHGVDAVSGQLSAGLRAIEERFYVRLLYGRRTFGGPAGEFEHELLLVDARSANLLETNTFKLQLWQEYHFESNQFEWLDEFDMVIKAAAPSFAAIELLAGADARNSRPRYLIAHEWMGIPLALCAGIRGGDAWRLVFYAHEMATARVLVEEHPGHDTRFYNVMEQAKAGGLTLEALFGHWDNYFKHALIKQAAYMHQIIVVGDWVEKELRFLGGPFAGANIDLVYNGLPFQEIDLEERSRSTALLQDYCQNLLGFRPDHIFTHVTRMVISKGIWRDIAVLRQLDPLLAEDNKTAVLFLLSSAEPAGRPVEDILRWEAQYGWPVVHQVGNGDLVGHEAPLYQGIETFNIRSRAIKIVFVNQFGWSRDRCGLKMPASMHFSNLRQGTDLEFGQSIYEPFGIAQIEPLSFGALGVLSNVCGCIGFVEQAARDVGRTHFTNMLQADYTTLTGGLAVYSPWEALEIGQEQRDQLERANSRTVAMAIRATLPTTPKQVGTLLRRGQQVGAGMSWEVVARDYFLPALERAG